MDDLDKKLFKDLSEKTVIPSKCEYVIKNAFNNNQRKNKSPIRNILLISFKDKRAAGKTAALNAINWYTGRGARGYEGWNILGKTG